MQPVLRYRDGYPDGTPELRGAVQRVQRALIRAGHEVTADGFFGRKTERTAKAFQRAHGLAADGVVGPATWSVLQQFLPRRNRHDKFDDVPGFENFHGDLAWVHAREGHVGKPYWPGGQSGVTLDPGFDLRFQILETVRRFYGSFLKPRQIRALGQTLGLRGQRARAASRKPVVAGVRVSRARGLRIMPHVAVPYWKKVVRNFPRIGQEGTPGSVQTVMLSLAYNRGPRNPGLNALRKFIERGNWLATADAVGSMQQEHQLQGIRTRRRMEADLIRQELVIN